MPFLSRAEEAIINQHLAERRAREEEAATAAAEKAAEESSKPKEKPVVHVARDGTTLESMAEAERDLIVDARKQVSVWLKYVAYAQKSLVSDYILTRATGAAVDC